MPTYNTYMMRHGEHGVQALLEQIERAEGRRANMNIPLEDRWNALMAIPLAPLPPSAAMAA